jgi:hypothetical protein
MGKSIIDSLVDSILVRVSPKGCSYDKKHGFKVESPLDSDLVECYVQKHFPKGFVIVDQIEMPPSNQKKKDEAAWFEYQIFGPFKTEDDFRLSHQRMMKRGGCTSAGAVLAYKDGIRYYEEKNGLFGSQQSKL